MSNRYNTNDKIKWALVGIAFALVFVMLVGMCLQLFAKDEWKPSEWFKKNDQEQNEILPNENGGAILNESEETGISVMSRKLLSSEYAANGVSTQAESAYTLTATINPSDATYTDVEWTVAFKNPSSTWANGKNLSDYVTLSSNGLQATVSCLKPFGEQIIVKVTSLDNASATANCSFDYRKRVTDATVSLKPASGTALALSSNINTVTATVMSNTAYTVQINVTETDGTVASNYTVKYSFGGFIDNFLNVVGLKEKHSGDLNPGYDWGKFSSASKNDTSIKFDASCVESWLHFDDYVYEAEENDTYVSSCISKIYAKGVKTNLGRWRLNLTESDGTTIIDKDFYFAINVNSIRIGVSGIGLNSSSYVF